MFKEKNLCFAICHLVFTSWPFPYHQVRDYVMCQLVSCPVVHVKLCERCDRIVKLCQYHVSRLVSCLVVCVKWCERCVLPCGGQPFKGHRPSCREFNAATAACWVSANAKPLQTSQELEPSEQPAVSNSQPSQLCFCCDSS